MWFNLIVRVKPYQFLTEILLIFVKVIEINLAGVAWLSSVRVVKRLVNSENERNPCVYFK
jgi:hypothetical protein